MRLFSIITLGFVAACAAPRPTSRAAPAPESASSMDYDSMLETAQSAIDVGHAQDAATIAAAAANMSPKRPEAYIVWGRALAQLDALPESGARYEQARALGSRDPTLFAELGSVYDVTKHYKEAVSVYRDYLSDHPDDAGIRDELGLTLLLLEKPAEAVTELETAHRARPHNLQVEQDLGYALLCAKRFGAARDILQGLVQEAPQSRDAWRFLAQAYTGLGDEAAAQKIMARLGEKP